MAVWPYWYRDVLADIGAPDTPKNELFLNVWSTYELSGARNNPLNTTLPWQGATDYNSFGVKNYPSPSAGAAATGSTLAGSAYQGIVAALMTGNPFTYSNPESVAAGIRTWGTPLFANWYLTQGPTAQTGPLSTGTGPGVRTIQVEQAWLRLMKVFGMKAPAHLARVRAARTSIRQAVR